MLATVASVVPGATDARGAKDVEELVGGGPPRELLVDPPPRPEFDDAPVDGIDPPEVAEIGPQRVGENAGVEAVVLGTNG